MTSRENRSMVRGAQAASAIAADVRLKGFAIVPSTMLGATALVLAIAFERDYSRFRDFYHRTSQNLIASYEVIWTVPEIWKLLGDEIVQGVGRELFGDMLAIDEVSFRLNVPGSFGNRGGWHRDRPLNLGAPPTAQVALLLYLSDVTGEAPRFAISPRGVSDQSPDKHIEALGYVAVEGPLGTAVFFDVTNIHALLPPTGECLRRACIVYFTSVGTLPMTVGHPLAPPYSGRRTWLDGKPRSEWQEFARRTTSGDS